MAATRDLNLGGAITRRVTAIMAKAMITKAWVIMAMVTTTTLAVWSTATAHATPSAEGPIGKARLDIAVGPFIAKGGLDLRGEARYRYRVHALVDLVAQGRAGLLRADGDADNRDELDQPVLSLAVGAMVHTRPQRAAWEFAGGLLVAHVHHATVASWKRTPLANLAGDSVGSVRHRSGLEFLAAATAPPIAQLGDYALLLGVDAGFTWLPSSPALQTSAGGRITLGLRWQPPRPPRPSAAAPAAP